MKNVINYYYNLYPDKIFVNDTMHYFFINNIKYSFIKYDGDEKEISNIYNLHLDMRGKNIYVHPIILNLSNTPLTYVDGVPFILMQVLRSGEKIDLNKLMSFSNVYALEGKNKWGDLWSLKNDYLEYQMSMLGKKHPILRDSFSYFIGLAETAIALANMTSSNNYVYAHKRINHNSDTFDLYNPLNITVDVKVRDIAEYIKNKFFSGDDVSDELDSYLKIANLSVHEIILFLARMLYPTYYFDLYEEIITDKLPEEKIIPTIDRVLEYEGILKKIYHYYKDIINFIPIEWLE